MNTIDLTPLYRTVVGFDRTASLLDQARRLEGTQGYPPYNIERVEEDRFTIELAVAGFSDIDLDIEVKDSLLTIAGRKHREDDGQEQKEYLHRGIAQRSFIRRFQLADHVIVTGADLRHGILRISLIRDLPEAKKPRKILIGAPDDARPKLVADSSNEALAENAAIPVNGSDAA